MAQPIDINPRSLAASRMTVASVKRGRITVAERAEIERLATTLRNPTPGRIAYRLNRHVSTVTWYMLTHGLLERKPRHAAHEYVRNGKVVHPYTKAQDDRLLALRIVGNSYRAIAEILTVEFGIERNCHSVQVRAVQLAAAPDDQEAA